MKEDEERLLQDLTAFRTEKFALYLFINTLWIIVSTIVLKYTASLLKVPITLPSSFPNCGTPESEVEQRDIDGGDTDLEDEPIIMYLQPFSLFFLFFYIILIMTQFLCMLWHRLSTLYHYVAQIEPKTQWAEIKAKKEHNYKSKLKVETGTDEEIATISTRQLKIQETMLRSSPHPKPSKNKARTTIRFDDQEDVIPEEESVANINDRRHERRRTSLFTNGILFSQFNDSNDINQTPPTVKFAVIAEVEESESIVSTSESMEPSGCEVDYDLDNEVELTSSLEDFNTIQENSSKSNEIRRQSSYSLTVQLPLGTDTNVHHISKTNLFTYHKQFYTNDFKIDTVNSYDLQSVTRGQSFTIHDGDKAGFDNQNSLRHSSNSLVNVTQRGIRTISPIMPTRNVTGITNGAFLNEVESTDRDSQLYSQYSPEQTSLTSTDINSNNILLLTNENTDNDNYTSRPTPSEWDDFNQNEFQV